jgi:hypothetical protein|tara:strand:+ start:2376 stop:2612 length:237 start_codon:yes stop_codon:yes gene_type:complete
MCRLFDVSRGDYYECRSRPLSPRKQQDEALKTKIAKLHGESRATYGTPHIQKQLSAKGKIIRRRRISKNTFAAPTTLQ